MSEASASRGRCSEPSCPKTAASWLAGSQSPIGRYRSCHSCPIPSWRDFGGPQLHGNASGVPNHAQRIRPRPPNSAWAGIRLGWVVSIAPCSRGAGIRRGARHADGPQQFRDGRQRCGDGPQQCGDGPQRCGDGPQQCGDGPQRCGDGRQRCGDGPQRCGGGPHRCRGGPAAARSAQASSSYAGSVRNSMNSSARTRRSRR